MEAVSVPVIDTLSCWLPGTTTQGGRWLGAEAGGDPSTCVHDAPSLAVTHREPFIPAASPCALESSARLMHRRVYEREDRAEQGADDEERGQGLLRQSTAVVGSSARARASASAEVIRVPQPLGKRLVPLGIRVTFEKNGVDCGKPLPASVEVCPACRGRVVGRIKRAAERDEAEKAFLAADDALSVKARDLAQDLLRPK